MKIDNIEVFAFVLMPFDDAFNDIYKLGIQETANNYGIKAERVDEQIFQEGILERIYRQIQSADIVIADLTGQNPNVFYELGYAHALNKLCVLLIKNADDIPFDLKHHRHIIYGDSITGLKKRLSEELSWAKNEILNVRSSKIKVALKNIDGTLEKTKYSAKGNITIKIDLHNESNSPSADLEAIYFYCGKDWILYQDGKECASTESDLPEYKVRHFLKPPLRKLHKKSWAQIVFDSKKYLAWSTEGDELKDSYHVSGKSVIRLVTSEGNFDYELLLNVMVDDLPF